MCKDGYKEIRNELTAIKIELQKLEMLDQLTESINFMSAKFDQVFKDVAENKKKIVEIQKDNKELKILIQTVKGALKELNDFKVKNDCIINYIKVSNKVCAIDAVVGVVFELFQDAYFPKNIKTI